MIRGLSWLPQSGAIRLELARPKTMMPHALAVRMTTTLGAAD